MSGLFPSGLRARLSLWPLALLLAEYLWISVQFDALPLLESAGVAHGFGHLGILAPLIVVVATLTYILSGRALRKQFAELLAAPGGGARRSLGVASNALCFVGLHVLTANLLGRAELGRAIAWPWLALWIALVLGTASSLLVTLLPARAVRLAASGAVDALVLGCVAGALAWAAGLASERLWESLSVLTLRSVYLLMLPFSHNIVYVPDELAIGTEDFVVLVAPECSGIEGIGLIVVVMSLYLWSARKRLRFPRVLGVLPVAVLAVWLGNSARIALLIAVGVEISPEIALSGFHSKAGWLFFCAIALGLIALVQRTRWLLREDAASGEDDDATWNPAATYLSPLLALIATGLLTALFSTGFDALYGLRVLAVVAALYLQRKHLPRAAWPASWQAPLIGVAVFALWLALCTRPGAAEVTRFKAQLAGLGQPMAAVWLALRALGSIVTVPLAEELAFRGFLLRRLIDRDFSEVDKRRLTVVSVAGSSLAFGLLHPGAIVAGSLAGVAYAFAQSLRGRTADAVIAHAITNALIAVHVLAFDAYWLWT
jgi:exosortase E/protease (VPEID-CTERM system)